MINKNFLFFLIISFVGCSSRTVDKLVTFKEIAQQQDTMQQMVREQDERFERMLNEVTQDTWPQFTHQNIIVEQYGDPVIKKSLIEDGHAFEIWIYRYAIRYFDSPKIYLTFDEQGGLVEVKIIEVQQKE